MEPIGRPGRPAIPPPWRWGVLLGAIALVLALGPLDGIPHVTDEVAYTLQARLFAAGMRTGPGSDPGLTSYPMWVAEPRAHAVFPPGWPALLAAFEGVGVGWLANPLLAVVLPPLVWLVARERVGDDVARLAAAVAALSPGAWVLAASRMSHTSVLAALLALAAVVVRGRDRPAVWAGGGMAAAYVVLARPFDAAITGGPLLVWGAWRAVGSARRAALLLPPALAALVILLDNHVLTGDPLTFAAGAWYEGAAGRPDCDRLGFGADVGCEPTLGGFGHSPEKALALARVSAERFDRLLLGFPGGLLIAAVGLWLGGKRLAGLAVLGLAPPLAYAFYWSPGAAYGARFWHAAYLVLPVLVAVALHRVLGRLAWGPPAVLAALAAPGIAADLGSGYWCVDDGARRSLAEAGATDGLVVVQARGSREEWWPALRLAMTCDETLEFGDAFLLTDPTGRGRLEVRRAPSTREALDALADREPGRRVWLLQHDIATDTRRVLAVR